MRRSLPSMFALALLATVAVAAPDPERDATDRAQEHLAAGDPGGATRILTEALGRVEDDAARDRIRCLLGGAYLADGAAGRAEEVLRAVRPDGPCGVRAGWSRVDALLSLDRAEEAATVAEALAEGPTGSDRDGASAEGVAVLARRLAADPERGLPAALRLFDVALRMKIAPARRDALADEAYGAWQRVGAAPPAALCRALTDGLRDHEAPELRARAAEVCGSQTLAVGIPAGPLRERVAATLSPDRTAAALGLSRALGAAPSPEDARQLARRWEALQVTAARDALGAVGDAEAGRRSIAVAAAAGRGALVASEARAWLDRWPTDPRRAEVVDREATALLDLARSARAGGALAAYDALIAHLPAAPAAAVAGVEAGLAARAAGDVAGARRRWEALRAAFPGTEDAAAAVRSLARSQAFDDHDPDGAAAFLRGAADAGGLEELGRLTSEDLAISAESVDGGTPTVHLLARNLTRVELRVHRVDPLAWVRAGHPIEALDQLDVAPIAPDATVVVDLPDPTPWVDHALDVPVPVRGPGLYAVTAAGPAEEARALLLVSPLRAVTRTVGGDTVVAVFDESGRPVPRAAVHLVDRSGAVTGTTDRDGLFVTKGRSAVPAVLAEKGGRWALVPGGAETAGSAPSEVLAASVELDRAVYLPGDHVGARIVAHTAGQPVAGTWTIWLAGADATLPPVKADASALGSVTIDLPLPPAARAETGLHPRRDRWTLRALAPGEAAPRDLAQVVVAGHDPTAFGVTGSHEGSDLAVTVRDPDDLPAVGVPVRVDGQVAVTDAAGVVRVEGPRTGLPWAPAVEVPGLGAVAVPERPEPERARLRASLAEDVLRPGERPVLRLDTEGPVRVVALRAIAVDAAEPPPDPWVEAVDPELRGWRRADGDGQWTREGWWELALDATRDPAPEVVLEPLPPGDYDLVVIAHDQRATVHAPLRVDGEALRATGMRDVGVGEVLRLVPDGGAALVTAEGAAGLLWAGVRGPGEVAEIPVDGRWRGDVVLSATAADGRRHVRTVRADPDPLVTVEAVPAGPDAWSLRATVRDAAGRPLDAEVSFTAWDPRYEEVGAPPDALAAASLFPWSGPLARAWGDGGPLRDGDDGAPIAAALVAENELRRERARALEAGRSGLLSDNALADALLAEVPLEGAGVAGSGFGSGGSAFGSGAGQAWTGQGMERGEGGPRPLPGRRERVVWQVVPTVGGVASVTVDDPDALLTVRATAVTREGIGTATARVDTRGEVTLHVRTVPAGSPTDRAHPVATVVNDTAAPVEVTLSFGPDEVPLSLAAGASRRVVGPAPVAAGAILPVTLRGVDTLQTFAFAVPLAEGAPAADGPVTVVAAGPRALGAIATRGEPVSAADPARVAAAGRAALAAWRSTRDPDLVPRLEAARLALRGASVPPVARALLLADLAAGGPVPVPTAELTAALDAVRVEGSTTDRLRAALALALGGRPIAEGAALRAEAQGDGEGVWAARLARAEGVGPGPVPPAAPPLPGDEALVDWLVVHAADPVGAATVDGAPVAGVRVVAGAPQIAGVAHAWRATGVEVGAEGVRAGRVPRGTLGVADAAVPSWKAGACDPCRVALDEAIHLPEGGVAASAWMGPAGGGAQIWRARAPGVYLLPGVLTPTGRTRGVRVEVEAGPPGDAPPAVAFHVGAAQRAAGIRAAPPATDEVPAGALARAALDDALLGGDDAEIAAAYAHLRAADPAAALPAAALARAARSLRAVGRSASAVDAWRAVVDHEFAAELQGLTALEGEVGPLAAVQRAREAIGRAPLGTASGEAAYLLPGRLLALARDGLPPGAVAAGLTATDARLTAAAWDRELLATFPDHPRAAAAGLRLGHTLLELHAAEGAAAWAERVRRAHPGDALSDALVFLEAVARTEAGDASAAEPLLRSLAEDLFPDADGPPVPSAHAGDARLALARLAEARGRFDEAARAYAASGTTEALGALAVLRARSLEVSPLVQIGAGDPATLPVVARGVDRVSVRAYRVDLRTLFLRDQGLGDARSVAVDGVSPVWSSERSLDAGPFPETHPVPLPLAGAGAWLVQLEADDVRATTLVVRSGLELDVHDSAGARRVDLRSGGRPVAGAEVRGLSGGQVFPAVTDVRGVAVVPIGAAVLAWRGDEVAFTAPGALEGGSLGGGFPSAPSSPLSVIDRRLDEATARDDDAWQQLVAPDNDEVSLPGPTRITTPSCCGSPDTRRPR